MARMRQPTARDIDALLAFLPKLHGDGFAPIKDWVGGGKEDGVLMIPYPEYDQTVHDFVHAIVQDGWMDSGYVPEETGRLVESEGGVETASLPELRALLTYFVRGERFSDGWWGHMIEAGHVRRILERLAQIREEL